MKKLLVAILLVLLPMAVNAAVHYDEDLDDYADKSAAESGPWGGTADGRITLASGAEALGGTGKCWKIDWTTRGTIALALPLTSLNLSQVYVRFYYKNVKDEGPSGSISKVLKMFGVRDGDNYANWTLAQGYQQITRLSIGTGAGISNDSTCVLRYGSSSDGCLGDGVVDTYTPDYLGGLPIQDGSWHCIEAFFKYNTTTDGMNNADGAFSLWFNGTKIYGVTGIIMRHPDNSIYFSSASFGDHAQEYLGYYEYFDSIVISDSYVGPEGGTPPADTTPPTVTISTSDPQAVSTDSVSIAWTDSDDIGVTSRKWHIGSAPDATHGTECTSPATITGLSVGSNTVYIGAGDAAGNWGSDSITVNYSPVASSTIIINSGIRGGGGVR